MAGIGTELLWRCRVSAISAHDLELPFDHLSHDHIPTRWEVLPREAQAGQWLRAGVIEDGKFLTTDEGARQGSSF